MKGKKEEMKSITETDEKCIDLDEVHGGLVKMECMHPWSDEVHMNAKSPFRLSGWYKLTFEDGAEVEVASVYSYALAQGSFWLILDHTDEVADCVFVREPKALAYFAKMGATLTKDKVGQCDIPDTVSEAEKTLWGDGGLDVPYEPLRADSETVKKNMERWIDKWKASGLIRLNESQSDWEMTAWRE